MNTSVNRIVVEPGTHSSRGASSASRWIACPGNILLTERLAKQGKISTGSSVAAAEGTAAHLILSTCFEDGTDAHEMEGVEVEVEGMVFIVDQVMIDGVQECLDWVRNRIAEAELEGFETTLLIEKSMTSMFDEDVYGTADIILIIHGDRIIVVDFKYGRGVTVEPDSEQNFYYIYLVIENYLGPHPDDFIVESWIAQPRIPHPEGTIRCFDTTTKEIEDWWMNVVLPAIEATRDPTSPLVMGTHCKFCKNKMHCPALQGEVQEFSVGAVPSTLTEVELGVMLDKLATLRAYHPLVESEALGRARQGIRIPGRKLVRKMSNRIYRDTLTEPDEFDAEKTVVLKLDDAATKQFGDDAFVEPKLKTPAQIEKLTNGGRDFAKRWAYKPDAGTTLAKESDKRTEVRPDDMLRRVRSGF